MSRDFRVLALFGAVLLLGFVFYFVHARNLDEALDDSETPASELASEETRISESASTPVPILPRDRREPGAPAVAAIKPLPLANPAERSPLADKLHAPEQTGVQDLAIVLNLFDYYLRTFSALPSGENNAQIVNALAGNNPRRVAFIERSHPGLNAAGELTDRWGTPLFFHLIASDALEIRSAGPDKLLWSEDDQLTASPRLRATPPPSGQILRPPSPSP